MATLFQVPQFFDNAGNPLSSGKLYWCAAGTSTLKNIWKDEAETTLHANPIILETDGRPPGGAIFIRGSYKAILKSSDDSIIYFTIDNINEYDSYDFTGLTASIADLNSTTTTAFEVTGTYNVILADRNKTILADASSAPVTINLLSTITALDTFKIGIKKTDKSVNTVTIVPFGVQTVNGSANMTLYDYNDFAELKTSSSTNWEVLGSTIRGTLRAVATTTTLDLRDNGNLILASASAGSFVINLPSILDVGRGFLVGFKKTDDTTNTITVTPSGTQKIDGKSTYDLLVLNQVVYLKSGDTNWFVVNETQETTADRTGSIAFGIMTSLPGYVLLNDLTIGDASSNATNRANADTADLFALIWNQINNTYCPVYTSAGVLTTRGVSASADFAAHKAIRLPLMQNRVPMGGIPGTSGVYNGSNTATLALANLAQHSHTFKYRPNSYLAAGGGGSVTTSDELDGNTSTVPSVPAQPFSIIQPYNKFNFFMKL